MISSLFLKQCIAEVLLEPVSEAKKTRLDTVNAFVKECIAEVLRENLSEGFDPTFNQPDTTGVDLSEPQSWKKKGQRVQVSYFKDGKNHTQVGVIKEPGSTQAIIKLDKGYNTVTVPWEFIKPMMNAQFGVNEGFDPQSDAGPNPTQENPYPEWNNKMRQMEEEHPHGREAQEAGATPLNSTFAEIRKKYDPDGTKHDLKLTCVKCGTTHTCRCGTPKRTFKGICDACSKQPVNELQSASIKWKCPYCLGSTKVLVEIESPSDYISCSDCDKCGKEINDPRLDMRIYEEVIRHFAGRQILK